MILDIQLDNDIREWLDEDVPYWDISFVQSEDQIISAKIMSKDRGIIAGVQVARRMLQLLDIEIISSVSDGDLVDETDAVLSFKGKASKILRLERSLLNIMSHMTGIATYTRNLVNQIETNDLKTKIAATRKTLPGLRKYQKWAVIIGGGDTHRLNLSAMALIKENHIITFGSISQAIEEVKSRISFSHKIEIEIRTDEEALEAARGDVDIIMLDNYTPEQASAIIPEIKIIDPTILIEASGGITEKTFMEFANAGVDIISLGKLTHSVKAFDFSLLFDE